MPEKGIADRDLSGKSFLCSVCGSPGVYLTDEGLMCRTHALDAVAKSEEPEEDDD